MKSIFEMLVLTRREQRVVVVIVLVMILIVAFVRFRSGGPSQQAYPTLKTMGKDGTVSSRLTDEDGSARTRVEGE